MEMDRILAIDQSTSSSKALLFTREGQRVDSVSVSHEQIYPQPGWVEHDAEMIWKNTLTAVQQLMLRHPGQNNTLAWVSITNQRETFVVFEKGSGKPVGHAIVWQCTRSQAVCERLKTSPEGARIKAETGLELDSYFSAPKLKWWIGQDPKIGQKLRHGEYLFGTIDTYLIYRMTRGAVYATDPTNASRTMLYSLKQRCWEPFLCEAFDVAAANLPEIRDCDSCFGETDFEGILPSPIPIIGVMGDSQAALFAQRCFEPGSTKVTLGTGSSLLYNIGEDLVYSKNGVVTALASVVNQRPCFCFEGIIRFSSAIMDWLQHQMGLFASIREADAIAEATQDSAGVYLVPAFSGLGAPYWDAGARAAIVGLTAHSTRAHIIRAGFEAMVFQVRDVLEMMETEVGIPCSILNVDGGPTKSTFLMQLLADCLQRPICVASLSECSALGAVMAGMLGSGGVADIDALKRLPRDEKHYQPLKNKTAVDTLYHRWKLEVQRSIPSFPKNKKTRLT